VKHKKHEIWALCLAVLSLLALFSVISYHGADFVYFDAPSSSQRIPPAVQNRVGSFGAHLAWLLITPFGLGAYALIVGGFVLSWCLFRGRLSLPQAYVPVGGAVLVGISLITLLAIQAPDVRLFVFGGEKIRSGGSLGLFLSEVLLKSLYRLGAHIFLVGALLLGLLLSTPMSLASLWTWVGRICVRGGKVFSGAVRRIAALFSRQPEQTRPVSPVPREAPRAKEVKRPAPPVEVLLPVPVTPKVRKPSRQVPPFVAPPKTSGLYRLPDLDLVDAYEVENHKPDWKKLEDNARILEEKLADFGVQGKVMDIAPGPVITMYEYAPAPGIKISRIVGLADDLSMALKAISIRVVAPIPGKAAIGIEIPNHSRETVSIRAVLESEAYLTSPSPLTIALGKDITGQPVVANLAKMPHLLIAGATGTGKSVCINTLLSSLLFRKTPEDLRLLLIDPKRIELSTYEGIPHLIHPVVTDAKMATRGLRWAVEEMELRYKLLADKNARNIEGYNKIISKEKPRAKGADPSAEDSGLPHHRLPYMVIIIDELADLMMVASREVEESITRLAQMARAAGIHLILATQRPSVDVLTGIIKANIPTRISFQVSSRIDSRTILDTGGAESLLGSGDMLFLPPGTAKLQRIHGAFVSEQEVQRLTEFWRSQKLVEDPLRDRVRFEEASSSGDLSEEELDEKYEEAVQLVLDTRQASISMLQRRLRVGYNRAARMIEIMEQQGIVGVSDGIKPREVIGRRDS